MTVDYVEPFYLLTVLLFILGLRGMSSPATARQGIVVAGIGMLIAVVATVAALLVPGELLSSVPSVLDLALMAAGVALGGGIGWLAAKRVAMTDMPQMVAIYNGMGGGAAGAIAAVELYPGGGTLSLSALSVVGGLIGAISFAGSIIAFLKLQGWMRQKAITYPGQQPTNILALLLAIVFGVLLVAYPGWGPIARFDLLLLFVFALGFGALLTLPIGGADMPVVISLFNAFTGIAVGLDGFAISNYAMVVGGVIVGAAGSLLTILMAQAMNRSIPSVLFGAFGATEETGATIAGSMKPIDADDVAVMMAYAQKVVIAPGYGMAVAQAQQKVKELTDQLESKGVQVKFAIHPVAGRMPGHMNVLLAEAGVPYDRLYDREEINPEFESADVVLVIGANDVVNPAARRAGSPLHGMPILDVDKAKNVIVLKRGQGKGFAGVENDLFYKDNARMLYGDASESVSKLVQSLKKL